MKRNLGLEPATTYLIVSTVVSLVSMGLSYYMASKQAKEQLAIMRKLQEAEIQAVAAELQAVYPETPYYIWYQIVKLTWGMEGYDESEPSKDKTMTYIIILAVGAFILLGRG